MEINKFLPLHFIFLILLDGPDLPLTTQLVEFYNVKNSTPKGRKSLSERIRKGYGKITAKVEPKYGSSKYRASHFVARGLETRFLAAENNVSVIMHFSQGTFQ